MVDIIWQTSRKGIAGLTDRAAQSTDWNSDVARKGGCVVVGMAPTEPDNAAHTVAVATHSLFPFAPQDVVSEL